MPGRGSVEDHDDWRQYFDAMCWECTEDDFRKDVSDVGTCVMCGRVKMARLPVTQKTGTV